MSGSGVKSIIRRSYKRWRWYVIDLNVTVDYGWGVNWLDAQQKAESRRLEYLAELKKTELVE